MVKEFLKEYKTLEENVRYLHNKTVYEYETGLDPELMERLKVCRLLRNYITHQNDAETFVCISQEQIAFLNNLNNELEKRYKHIKDKITKLNPITAKYTLQDVALRLEKSEYVPVVNENQEIVGVFNNELLVYYISQGVKPTNKVKAYIEDKKMSKSKKDYYFAKETDRLGMYHPKNKIIVIDADKKYLGIVKL